MNYYYCHCMLFINNILHIVKFDYLSIINLTKNQTDVIFHLYQERTRLWISQR